MQRTCQRSRKRSPHGSGTQLVLVRGVSDAPPAPRARVQTSRGVHQGVRGHPQAPAQPSSDAPRTAPPKSPLPRARETRARACGELWR
eukprot:2514437-Pleurochrysis_carterae.AAC.1